MRRAFVSAFARAMSRVRPGPHANGFEDSFLSRECGDACAEVDRHLGRDTHLLWAAAAAAAACPSRSTWPLVYLTSRAGFRALVMRARTSGATRRLSPVYGSSKPRGSVTDIKGGNCDVFSQSRFRYPKSAGGKRWAENFENFNSGFRIRRYFCRSSLILVVLMSRSSEVLRFLR